MKKTARIVTYVYFGTMATVLTFPGIQPFNRIEPTVFGLPFVFAWVLGWVAGAVGVFWFLYHAYQQ